MIIIVVATDKGPAIGTLKTGAYDDKVVGDRIDTFLYGEAVIDRVNTNDRGDEKTARAVLVKRRE